MSESLKDRTVKGLGWSALDNAARYGMQAVVGITVFLAVCKMTGIKEYYEILKILKKERKQMKEHK